MHLSCCADVMFTKHKFIMSHARFCTANQYKTINASDTLEHWASTLVFDCVPCFIVF